MKEKEQGKVTERRSHPEGVPDQGERCSNHWYRHNPVGLDRQVQGVGAGVKGWWQRSQTYLAWSLKLRFWESTRRAAIFGVSKVFPI